jgi:hypothetical protein
MTVDNVFHTLWTRHLNGDYDKARDKPLWMLLQNFIERHDGSEKAAINYDVSGRGAAVLADRVTL